MPTPHSWQRGQAAERQLQQGQHELAARAYRTLALEPELAPLAHLRLSLIAQGRGHYRGAVAEAVVAHATRVEDPYLLATLAQHLCRPGALQPAVAIAPSAPRPSDNRRGSVCV